MQTVRFRIIDRKIYMRKSFGIVQKNGIYTNSDGYCDWMYSSKESVDKEGVCFFFYYFILCTVEGM